MDLRDCKKCFHHLDCRKGSVLCRFWGNGFSRKIQENGKGGRVVACPRVTI